MIKTERLVIDELKREDVDFIMSWERNIDILIKEYDFIDAANGNPSLWYKYRKEKPRLKSYTVKNSSGEAIGFISIRNINKFFGTAILGITFNEKYLSQGYGTEALRAFLDYYFNEMNMRMMILDVGKYNFRAVKCYKKLGFKVHWKRKVLVESRYEKMVQAIKNDPQQYKHQTYMPFGDTIILVYYRMRLRRKDFNELNSSLIK